MVDTAAMSAVTALEGKKAMHRGGVAPTKLRMACGTAHTPSPTIRPVAMGMTPMAAEAAPRDLQAMNEPIAEPRHMSMATLCTRDVSKDAFLKVRLRDVRKTTLLCSHSPTHQSTICGSHAAATNRRPAIGDGQAGRISALKHADLTCSKTGRG